MATAVVLLQLKICTLTCGFCALQVVGKEENRCSKTHGVSGRIELLLQKKNSLHVSEDNICIVSSLLITVVNAKGIIEQTLLSKG